MPVLRHIYSFFSSNLIYIKKGSGRGVKKGSWLWPWPCQSSMEESCLIDWERNRYFDWLRTEKVFIDGLRRIVSVEFYFLLCKKSDGKSGTETISDHLITKWKYLITKWKSVWTKWWKSVWTKCRFVITNRNIMYRFWFSIKEKVQMK